MTDFNDVATCQVLANSTREVQGKRVESEPKPRTALTTEAMETFAQWWGFT